MNRRAFVRTGGLRERADGADGGGASDALPTPREPAARRSLLGLGHPHDRWSAPAPGRGFRVEGRKARQQDHHPQLRPRRRRYVVVLGYGLHRCRAGNGTRRKASRHRRLRCRGLDLGPPAPATRLRGHHLCHVRTTGHDLEHVARGLHSHIRPCFGLARTPEMGRAVQACGRDRLHSTPAPCWSQLRHIVDRQLLPEGHVARVQVRKLAASFRTADRTGGARTRPASVSHDLRHAPPDHADRTLHLPGRARSRLPSVRGPHCDPHVRHSTQPDVTR